MDLNKTDSEQISTPETSSEYPQLVDNVTSPITAQKKKTTLWTIISAAVIFLILFGVGILVCTKRIKNAPNSNIDKNNNVSVSNSTATSSLVASEEKRIYPNFQGKLFYQIPGKTQISDGETVDGSEIWVYENGKSSQLTHTDNAVQFNNFSVSADGQKIVYSDFVNKKTVLIEMPTMTTKIIGQNKIWFAMALSNKGDKLALIDTTLSNDHKVFIHDLTNQDLKQLNLKRGEYVTVAWSVDDSKLSLFNEFDSYSIINSDGSNEKDITALYTGFGNSGEIYILDKSNLSLGHLSENNQISILQKTTAKGYIDFRSKKTYLLAETGESGICSLTSESILAPKPNPLITPLNIVPHCQQFGITTLRSENTDSLVVGVNTRRSSGQYKILLINKNTGESLELVSFDTSGPGVPETIIWTE